jgi:hypothetical protein
VTVGCGVDDGGAGVVDPGELVHAATAISPMTAMMVNA